MEICHRFKIYMESWGEILLAVGQGLDYKESMDQQKLCGLTRKLYFLIKECSVFALKVDKQMSVWCCQFQENYIQKVLGFVFCC